MPPVPGVTKFALSWERLPVCAKCAAHTWFSLVRRLNIPHAVSLLHPDDHRAMFAIPWEGCTLFGTTDQDHKYPFSSGEPFTTPEEIEYFSRQPMPHSPPFILNKTDVLSTFSGVRPVINTGLADPSKESRRHIVFEEEGLVHCNWRKIHHLPHHGRGCAAESLTPAANTG